MPLLALPPKRSTALLIDPPAPLRKRIPPQSPAAGTLALPSPLVSPATLSSRKEVNTIFCVAVPFATRAPSTMIAARPQLPWIFTTTPGEIVRVTPELTKTPHTTKGLPDKPQVVSVDMVPEGTIVCE